MNESHPEYSNLPEAIKAVITQSEYAWMPDELKKTLQQDMTMPEVAED